VVRWRIYYEDGSSFSNEDGSLVEAPSFGVQAVVCDPDVFHAGDFVGLIDYLRRTGLVKFGSLTTNERYHDAANAARKDPDFDTTVRHVYEGADYYWFEGDR
jgi:hypothetical protein